MIDILLLKKSAIPFESLTVLKRSDWEPELHILTCRLLGSLEGHRYCGLKAVNSFVKLNESESAFTKISWFI